MSAFEWTIIAVVFVAVAALLAWLGAKDRRWLFLGIAVFVALPLLKPVGLPKIKITDEVRDLYDYIEEFPEDEIVLLTCDYDPGSKPELHPMTYAIMDHLCRRDIKFAVMELWPAGPQMANDALKNIAQEKYGMKPREDYVHLGFKTGMEVVIQALGNSLRNVFPVDFDGIPVDETPFLKDILALKDFGLIINISAGTPGTKEWVQQAGSRYEIPIATGCTGVQAPQSYPYYPKQLVGLLGGMAAAAEYERLIGVEAKATQGMEAQSSSHALIFLFVVFGNVVYFVNRRKSGRQA